MSILTKGVGPVQTPKKVKHYLKKCEICFNVASSLLFVGLVAAILMWALQTPSLPFVKSSQHLSVVEGQTVFVNQSLVIGTDTNKAAYYMWLADEKGHTIYRYPSRVVNEPSKLEFGNTMIRVPESVKPGSYTVKVNVQYRLNPIKVVDMNLDLAKLTVLAK